MAKYIFYACTGEELVRYACEHILLASKKPSTNISTASLLAESGVFAFSDRSAEIWGTLHCGLPILPPHEQVDHDCNKLVAFFQTRRYNCRAKMRYNCRMDMRYLCKCIKSHRRN